MRRLFDPSTNTVRFAGWPRVDAVRDPHVQREQPPSALPEDRRIFQVIQPLPVS